MFSVIISEKGGAERRETFDRTEINVGRVQGNDLMLPKGNVSKRHARLLYRDGRFIVTDLKSTNGTYVNGRKIAQATIVREGDKIYIGDFVVRIEAGSGPSPSQPAAAAASPVPIADELPSDLESVPPGLRPLGVVPTAPSPAAAPSAHDGASRPVPIPTPFPGPIEPLAPRLHDGTLQSRTVAPVLPPSPLSAVGPLPATPRAGADAAASVPLPPSGAATGPLSPNRVEVGGLPPNRVEMGALSPRAEGSRPPLSPEVAVLKSSSFPLEPPSSSSQPSSNAEKALRAPSPRIEPKTGDRHEVISHFPLEHDPDESVHFAVPGPPRVPSPPRPLSGKAPPLAVGSARGAAVQPTAPGTPFTVPIAMPGPGVPPLPERPTSPSIGLASLGIVAPAGGAPPAGRRPLDGARSYPVDVEPAVRARATSIGERPGLDPARSAAQRLALIALVDRVAEAVDLRALASGAAPDGALVARIERALVEATASLRDRSDLDVDALLVDARRELCEYGPLTPLFDEEDLSEIQVVRHDYVVALHGRQPVASEIPSEATFTSEQAVGRAIRRLCIAAGKPLAEGEIFVERRLARGGRMFAVLPRAEDHGHMVVIRKPQRADLTLEDLVRSGTISRAISGLLTQCVAAHANILVTGAVGAGTTTLLGALAGAGSTEDRVVVLQEDDELVFNQPHTISILLGDTAEERARAVQAAARVRPDRLVVGAFAGAAAAELVDAMGNGVDGVLAGARAPTLRQAVLRLTADIAATRPGISPEVAREWLGSVFDLAIEIARLRDGRHRVLRVAELAVDGTRVALRDIFTFTVERTAAGGAIEGSFVPTGTVPAIVEDLAARGVPVDPSIFRRHSRPEDSGIPTRTPAEGLILGALPANPRSESLPSSAGPTPRPLDR